MTLLYIVEKIKDGNIIGVYSSFFKMSAKSSIKKDLLNELKRYNVSKADLEKNTVPKSEIICCEDLKKGLSYNYNGTFASITHISTLDDKQTRIDWVTIEVDPNTGSVNLNP